MQLLTLGHTYHFEMENLTRVFFPYAHIKVSHEPVELTDEPCVITEMSNGERAAHIRVQYKDNDRTVSREETVSLPNKISDEEKDKLCELRMANLLFDILYAITGNRPAWGILTGVRPIKLLRRLIAEDGEAAAEEYFRNTLRVSEDKIRLALDCQRYENVILEKSRPDSYSLYISIPFCPSRCAYCSFVSQSVEQAGKLITPYLEKLHKELEETARIAEKLRLRLETVYVGGGTPTILTPAQLSDLLYTVKNSFDMTNLRELTVEAGRPDTIDRDKLAVMKAHNVSRISINPQTLNDHILEKIGRRHTSEQTREAFRMARQEGFDNINMDLIAGLPGDTLESFKNTMSEILSMAPESVTVHTLALKRSARFVTDGTPELSDTETAKMVTFSQQSLYSKGYIPYYLYRQSRMVGNLENVGWALPGYEGYYNAYIMDETHTILACGAGGVTKLREPGGDYIERIFNYKFPYEYCNRFDEMLIRKKGVVSFYENLG